MKTAMLAYILKVRDVEIKNNTGAKQYVWVYHYIYIPTYLRRHIFVEKLARHAPNITAIIAWYN